MNKTRKLTQGAMMIAIVGAMILLDRLLANTFDVIVTLVAPVVIVMYSCMYTLKDGLFVAIGILVVTFLFGNTDLIYMIYIPIGCVTGLAYSYVVNKNLDKRTAMFASIISYVIGEIMASFVVYPLLGINVTQQLSETKVMLQQLNYSSVLEMAGLNIDKIILIAFIIGTVLLGLMEGVIIHLLSSFLLKRFKIKDLGQIDLWNRVPNKIVAYISFLSTFPFFFKNIIPNENIYYVLVSIGIVGVMILIYYGYMFIVFYGRIVLGKNIASLFIIMCLFFAPLLLSLVILGFLYGSGPLRRYLERKLQG